jgi:hypothetical protein
VNAKLETTTVHDSKCSISGFLRHTSVAITSRNLLGFRCRFIARKDTITYYYSYFVDEKQKQSSEVHVYDCLVSSYRKETNLNDSGVSIQLIVDICNFVKKQYKFE